MIRLPRPTGLSKEEMAPRWHSIIQSADFVSPFIAQVLGLIRELEVSCLLQDVVWPEFDPRLLPGGLFCQDDQRRDYAACSLPTHERHVFTGASECMDSSPLVEPEGSGVPCSGSFAGIMASQLDLARVGKHEDLSLSRCTNSCTVVHTTSAPAVRTVRFSHSVAFWFPAHGQLEMRPSCPPRPNDSGSMRAAEHVGFRLPCAPLPGHLSISIDPKAEHVGMRSPCYASIRPARLPYVSKAEHVGFRSPCTLLPNEVLCSNDLNVECDDARLRACVAIGSTHCSVPGQQFVHTPPRPVVFAPSATSPDGPTTSAGPSVVDPIIGSEEVAPFARPVVHLTAADGIKFWFTFFGVVEGHQVLQRQPNWGEAQCVREAIAHASPALARPAGRAIREPLPGLFQPQVVLTRLPPQAPFRTVVFDLRPIGAHIRTEDVRIQRGVVDFFQGEGALAPFLQRSGVAPGDITFSVNLLPPTQTATFTDQTETVTVYLQTPAISGMVAAGVSDTASCSGGPYHSSQKSTAAASIGDMGSGAAGEERASSFSEVLPPPIPEPVPVHVPRVDGNFQTDLSFTVFDRHFHKRVLPRRPGQDITELVQSVLALTPQLQRPWGFRVHDCIWEDLPTPQLTVWGALPDGYRVFPVRDMDAPDQFCTVQVPVDASALQASIEASITCEPFRQVRFQIARMERLFLINHVAVPPFAADSVQQVQIAAVRRALAPTIPEPSRHRRWRPEAPHLLQVLDPGEHEDLWPVQEVIVHLQHRASHRVVVPFEESATAVCARVRRELRLSVNCALRLPTYCPIEPGAPLHLFLHQYQIHDPWNDPDVPPTNWALVDLRRVLRPPRPSYVMLPVPRSFDMAWLRAALFSDMPDLDRCAVAYIGQDMLVDHCSPHGNVPLITVFPDAHFVFQPPFLANCVLDTHTLLDLRSGFNDVLRTDRNRERQFPAQPRHADQSQPATSVQATYAFSGPRPLLLSPVYDDEVRQHAQAEVLVFCPGQCPRLVQVPRHLSPDLFLQEAARGVDLVEPCTLHVPTLGPLVPGHYTSVAVIPNRFLRDRRFAIVDARRVSAPGDIGMWLQELPFVLTPAHATAALRRAQPTLRLMGAFYVDSYPVRGYAELMARVSLLTILPDALDDMCFPTPLFNERAFRTRLGFEQLNMRYRGEGPPRPLVTTTSTTAVTNPIGMPTTTTTTPSGPGPSGHRDRVLLSANTVLRFHLAGPGGRVVSFCPQGSCSLEDVMTPLCMRLHAAGDLMNDLVFLACDRALMNIDAGFSVYLTASTCDAPDGVWLDATPFGVPLQFLPGTFELTQSSLARYCGGLLPSVVFVAINGVPWHGDHQRLEGGAVLTIRTGHHELFSQPLTALDERVAAFSCLLLRRPGPGRRTIVLNDGCDGDEPFQYTMAEYNPSSIRQHWYTERICWLDLVASEGGYERCVLITADFPPLVVAPGTRVAPEAAHVNLWYRTHLQRKLGPRVWRDAGLAYGSLTVMYDSVLHDSPYTA